MFKNILLATDFSSHSITAQKAVLSLAWDKSKKLSVLHVYNPKEKMAQEGVFVVSEIVESAEKKRFKIEIEKKMKVYCQPFDAKKIDYNILVQEGKTGQEIIRISDEINADMVVIGSHSKRSFLDISLGGVARYVAENAHCPVLIVTDFKEEISEEGEKNIEEKIEKNLQNDVEYRVDKTEAEEIVAKNNENIEASEIKDKKISTSEEDTEEIVLTKQEQEKLSVNKDEVIKENI